MPPTPVFTPPSYTKPPPFQAPTIQDALNQPGYQFNLQEGEKGLQSWAAAKGTLNSSDTGKALTNYAENAAQSDYQNVYNNMLQAYNTNYQTQYTDPYNISYQGATAAFAPQMTAYSTQAQAGQYQRNATYQDQYASWLAQLGLTQEQIQDLISANTGTTVNFGTS